MSTTAHSIMKGVTTVTATGTLQIYWDGERVILSHKSATICEIEDFKLLNRGQGKLNNNSMKHNNLKLVEQMNELCLHNLDFVTHAKWLEVKALLSERGAFTEDKQENEPVMDDRKTMIGGLDYMNNFELAHPGDIKELPACFKPKQVVSFKLMDDDEPYTATIVGIHFYNGKVKYDLAVWIGEPMGETRLYNVDSIHVSAYVRKEHVAK